MRNLEQEHCQQHPMSFCLWSDYLQDQEYAGLTYDEPLNIYLNSKIADKQHLLNVVIHEMCHAINMTYNKDSSEPHHGKTFRKTVREIVTLLKQNWDDVQEII